MSAPIFYPWFPDKGETFEADADPVDGCATAEEAARFFADIEDEETYDGDAADAEVVVAVRDEAGVESRFRCSRYVEVTWTATAIPAEEARP